MDWQWKESDREIWDRDLASYVPPRVYDAHAHMYEVAHFQGSPPPLCQSGPPSAGWDTFQERIAEILPDRQVSGLFFGFPNPHTDIAANNDFVARETRRDPASRAQMLITPDTSADSIREQVRNQGFVGLKCYHIYAREQPTFEASIPAYLPEFQVAVAHELGLSITLHIVRARALADSANQDVLRSYATRYPNARIILAHAARGFNPFHTLEGIHALRGLGNLWFDTSAVTDAGAIEAIIRTMGHQQVLYGSDFPVSHIRGRCVALGDSFLWLSADNTKLGAAYAQIDFTLVGIESLRTLRVATYSVGLTDRQVEDIFYHNSARLFSLPQ